MKKPIVITKSDGTLQAFDEEKLANSLKRAGTPDLDIGEIVDEVERTMKDGMKTEDIYRHAFDLLRQRSRRVAIKYSVRRALLDLGPDGFPFEKFVARIFRSWGYETLTDQTVMGSCISHEVDVVAWNADKLCLVEAKFHNEFGIKSDSKVALYIQARREDLADIMFDYGGPKRKFDEFWLVTNTKFTDQAVHYGECKGLKMIGWNYPATGNLHDRIDELGLQPVTCLTSLTKQQKNDLVGRDVLACIDIVGSPKVLADIGVRGAAADKVLVEAQTIIETAK